MSEPKQGVSELAKFLPINNPFWDFSLAIYRHASIQTLVLEMQDKFSINVNLVLWAMWLDNQQKVLKLDQWPEIEQRINPWVTHTKRYRHFRRELKAQIASASQNHATENQSLQLGEPLITEWVNFRSRVLKLELLSEQYQQALLFSLTSHAAALPQHQSGQHLNLSTLLTHHWRLPTSYLYKVIQRIEDILGKDSYEHSRR